MGWPSSPAGRSSCSSWSACPACTAPGLPWTAPPLVRELASIEDEIGTLFTVVLDRTAARLFVVTAFGAEELEDIRATTTPGGRFHSDRADAPGRGEYTYHNRIREEKQRHYAAVAERLFELNRRRPVHGVVLAGPGKEAGAVAAFLHPYLAERLMGVVSLNPKEVRPAVVYEATLATRAEFEREAERSVVHGLKNAVGQGWAVDGVEDTLRALGRGQVRTLLVDTDAERSGFRSGKTGRLAAVGARAEERWGRSPGARSHRRRHRRSAPPAGRGRSTPRRVGPEGDQGAGRIAALPVTLRAVLFDAGNTLLFLDYPRLARGIAEATGDSADRESARGAGGTGGAGARACATRPTGNGPGAIWRRCSAWPESPKVPWGSSGTRCWRCIARSTCGPASSRERSNRWNGCASAGYRLAVISNSDGRAAEGLAAAGLLAHFEHVIDSELVGCEKPDPRIFLTALEQHGAGPRGGAVRG